MMRKSDENERGVNAYMKAAVYLFIPEREQDRQLVDEC